jgi:hypothetical protein
MYAMLVCRVIGKLLYHLTVVQLEVCGADINTIPSAANHLRQFSLSLLVLWHLATSTLTANLLCNKHNFLIVTNISSHRTLLIQTCQPSGFYTSQCNASPIMLRLDVIASNSHYTERSTTNTRCNRTLTAAHPYLDLT